MKKILLVVLVIVFSLIFSNCGKKLTAPEAKDVIVQKFDAYIVKTESLSENEKKSIKKIAQSVGVGEVKSEDNNFVANVSMEVEGSTVKTEMKFSYYDGEWHVDEIQFPAGEWKPSNEALEEIRIALLKGKQKVTMGDMKALGTAVESYMTDWGFVPQVDSAEKLNAPWFTPFYIKTVPVKDAFGYTFLYQAKQDLYSIGSGGRDGKFNGFEQSGVYIVTSIDGFSNDIIFSNGMFTYGPKMK